MNPRRDLYTAFLFSIEVEGGRAVGGFSEVSGLVFETEVQIIRVGGMNEAEVQLPGPAKFPSRLMLKRGLGSIEPLWEWYSSVYTGAIERKDVTIRLKDEQNREVMSWGFWKACPVKWTGPDLRASNSAVAF